MKAVVLAGGYATRLWPITKDRPKMLLPLGESTIIDGILSELEVDDRITTVHVSTNEKFADTFRDHLSKKSYEKSTVSVEPTKAEHEKQGVVGALADLIDREAIDDDLLVVGGDNLISFDLGEFVDFFEDTAAPTLAAYDVGSRKRARSYGLLELDGDQVVDFQEKPDDPRSTLVSIACYGFPASMLDRLDEYLAAGNNPDEPGWFVQWLQGRDAVYAYTFEDAWFDIGTPNSYLDAVAWKLDGQNLIADSATLQNTTVGKNVHIMDDATLTNSNVDNAIVFPDATIADCDIRNSIIDEKTHVENMDLAGALIGAHTHIKNGE